MQQQFETEEQTENEFATQYRVTPQELTEAVTRVEMRHAAAMNETAETLTLGEAVEQLHLSMSPEELLAEALAARRDAEASAAMRNEAKAETTLKADSVLALRKRRKSLRLRTALFCAPPAAFAVMLYVGGTWFASAHRVAPVLTPPAALTPAQTEGYPKSTFEKIGEDQIFTMTALGVTALANSPNGKLPVSTAPHAMPNSDYVWRLEKWRGKTWVLGSVDDQVNGAELKRGAFRFHNFYCDDRGDFSGMKRVQIPVERFKNISEPPTHQDLNGVDWQTITIPAIEK